MSKTIYTGLESSGKSLKLAMKCEWLVERNSKYYEITNIKRDIFSNEEFTEEFTQWAKKKNINIKYWSNLNELILIKNADIIIDEIGNYFDSRLWADLSLDVRRWLTQGAKTGIEIYGSAQDFAQVDKSFRRLVNELYEITKWIGSPRPSATKPPVKKIWGLCQVRSINPRSYTEDKKEYANLIGDFFLIEQKYCKIFNTTQEIKKSKNIYYKHDIKECKKCGYSKIIHS